MTKTHDEWVEEVMTAANKFAGAHFTHVQSIMHPSEYKSDVAEQQAHLAKEKLRALLLEVPAPIVRLKPVAWARRRPDGTLTTDLLLDSVIEPSRKASGSAWDPLYAASPEYKEPTK